MTLKQDLLILAFLVGVAVLLMAGLVLRQRWLKRQGGTVDMSARLRPQSRAGGWATGSARYDGDCLQWFRTFSLAPRARFSLPRNGMALTTRRRPTGPESVSLPSDAVIVAVIAGESNVELAMSSDALTGFLAWMESAPPGSGLGEVV